MQTLFFPFLYIWGRYFLKETLKVLLLFITCFYGLYVLIDFSSHTGIYHHHQIRFRISELAFYYLSDFVKRLDILLPFALLISTIKTLCSLNINNELVALTAGGIRMRTLMRPFLFLGLLCTALIYVNTQELLPKALTVIKHIDDAHSRQKNKHRDLGGVQHVVLDDESTILFHSFDTSRQIFVDAYWIRNADTVYRFKFLHPYTEIPLGQYVDHFVRDASGQLALTESHALHLYPELRFNASTLLETLTPVEDLSLTQLKKKLPASGKPQSEKEAQATAVYYYKLAMPWFCLLAIIVPAPFCIRYTRNLPVFYIYAGCIFGFVAFYLILDASLILGKRQVYDPLLAIGIPFATVFGIFGYRYIKATR